MRCVNLKICLLNLLTLFSVLSLSHGRPNPEFRAKAVNLGGWLVTEGWIKPSLFDGIPNKDFLDGIGLQFKSVTTRKYLCAESGGGTVIVANRTAASGWETFSLWRLDENTFRFRVFNKQFVGLDGVKVVAVSNISTNSKTFHVEKESGNSNRAKTDDVVTADALEVNGWGDDDPSVLQEMVYNRIHIGCIAGPADPRELFPLTNGFMRPVIDVHYYNLFQYLFSGMTVQQNIDFVYNNRSSQLTHVTTSNGPLTFVGEWVAEWQVNGAAKDDYERFGRAQLDVYGRATFGWAYWAFENVNNHWSLEWMINNGYIKL
ncbi:unnamed protein product [Sphenostylis stenocarpa]|uniref:DUF7910 domain-containing protein n=1 Tax=Sphenostylis stenocarpa TaxID=92480 RepID=A0AA86T049_9FABA|nr:unnamed protein product [Sphenostylis stenocarpa]